MEKNIEIKFGEFIEKPKTRKRRKHKNKKKRKKRKKKFKTMMKKARENMSFYARGLLG